MRVQEATKRKKYGITEDDYLWKDSTIVESEARISTLRAEVHDVFFTLSYYRYREVAQMQVLRTTKMFPSECHRNIQRTII